MSRAKKKAESIQNEMAKVARKAGAERKGALVYWWLTGIMSHIDDVKSYYEQRGLDWDKWGPPAMKATVAFRQTLKEVGRDLNKKGDEQAYLIRPIDQTEDHLVYGIVREDKLKAKEDLAHQCESIVKLDRNHYRVNTSPDNGTEGYQVAQKVRDLFDTMFCHMIVQDFSRLLTRNMKLMQSVSIRPTGAVYFVPEKYRDVLVKTRAVLEDVPGDSHLCIIDIWGEQEDLARDTKKALEQELKDLQEEIKEFKEKPPRQDRLQNRLEEFKNLKEKGRMFAEVLSFNADEILKGLSQCGKAVEAFLNGGHFKGSEEQKAKKKTKTKTVRQPVKVKEVEEEPKKKAAKKKKVRKAVKVREVTEEKPAKRVSSIVQERRKAASKGKKKSAKGKKGRKKKAS